jgi:hypothetical protein
MWDVARVDGAASANLTWLNCLGAAALLAGATFVWAPNRDDPHRSATWYAVAVLVFGTITLLALCGIEHLGIRFYGGRRRWRITRDVAATIVGHASFGWLLLPVTLPTFAWLAARLSVLPLDASGRPSIVAIAALFTSAIAGPLIPMLAFETLVYIGFRRMRFANPPGAA